MSMAPDADDTWRRVDALFRAALELAVEERPGWLAARTGDDHALRAAVERLLAAVEPGPDEVLVPGGALAGALGANLAATIGGPRGLTPGTRVGPYEVVHELGRGGMAVVYRAQRVAGGFSQQVALKLLKRGTDTDEVLRRFTQERQILASLEHPAIARLYDGGATADGQPYLAMELVEGETIDRFCAERALGIEERLRLFASVGRAVEHAHRSLVVHRDIKPSNVLVTAEGQVKLLDFGIAKLIDPTPWPAAAPATRTHLRLLTPEYASPEQVRGEAVTTATDVYQLGLLLYELLTGKRPFELSGRTPTEVEEVICHQPPAPPSTALNLGARGLAGSRLARRIRGDLDNIVLKALAKAPHRRYASAGALVDDLERYLAGRPIEARPASLVYRASKFARRHAWSLGAAAAVLMVAASLTTLYTIRLARERDRAEHEAEKAEQVSRFLGKVLGAADPYSSRTGPLTARKLLDEGLRRIDSELAEPDIQAATLVQLGEIYRNLGLFAEARGCFERSLALRLPLYGDDSLPVAESRHLLGASSRALNLGRARELLAAALAVRRARLGPRHPEVARTLTELAIALRMAAEHDRARACFEEGRSILEALWGPEHPEVADVLVKQAQHYDQLEENAAGIALLERALAIRERASVPETVQVAEILMQLSDFYFASEEPVEAMSLLARADEVSLRTLDPEHPLFASLKFKQAKTLRKLGQLEPAYQRLEEALASTVRSFGPSSANTLMYLEEKSRLLKWMGRWTEALAVSQDFLARMESIFGAESPHLSASLIEHADILSHLGNRLEARATFDRGLALQDPERVAEIHLSTLRFHARLADDLGHPRAAELQARVRTRTAGGG